MELTDCDSIAKERLELILSNRLLRFNPYRVSDDELVACAKRGYWLKWPSITQMLIFHFQEIKIVHNTQTYYGLFFKVGQKSEAVHYGIYSFSRPMTHLVSLKPIWMTLNGKRVIPSNIDKLVNREVFVSHTINCRRLSGKLMQSYQLHLLPKNENRWAGIIRKSMMQSKIAMLEEVLEYPSHPDYLAYTGKSFDFRTPIINAIEKIRKYPDALLPSTHHLIKI